MPCGPCGCTAAEQSCCIGYLPAKKPPLELAAASDASGRGASGATHLAAGFPSHAGHFGGAAPMEVGTAPSTPPAITQPAHQACPPPAAAAGAGCSVSDDRRRECVVCADALPEVALIPCGHRCMCPACSKRCLAAPYNRRRCPICRQKVSGNGGIVAAAGVAPDALATRYHRWQLGRSRLSSSMKGRFCLSSWCLGIEQPDRG